MRELTPYQRRLLLFLSVATFFEGFDLIALTQILPSLRHDFGLDEGAGGLIVGVSNLGTALAFVLVNRADKLGRKRVMSLTILGYTVFSGLSALAPNAWVFTLAQLFAKLFLIAEWAVSSVVAAEEFPAHQRGTAIGLVQGASTLGSIACAALAPFLLQSPLGWRTVYLVGVVPLLLLAVFRRTMQETGRFVESTPARKRPLLALWSTAHAKRVLQLGGIWAATYIGTQSAVSFWKEHALSERGLSDKAVGGAISVAAIIAIPLVFGSGLLLDKLGRKWGATIIFFSTALGTYGAYNWQSRPLMLVGLTLAIFGASAVLPVLNAYTSELFPTVWRGDGYAWSNNVLGRVAYVIAPIATGFAAREVGWAVAVSTTALGTLLALALIWWWMPETRGRELEETSAAP